MVINEFTDKLTHLLGTPGHMMSSSKTGYTTSRPRNFAIFNGNIVINGEKVWYGDLDLTISGKKLSELARTNEIEISVLSEMDGRFENEDTPKLSKSRATYKKDGTVKYFEGYEKYYNV